LKIFEKDLKYLNPVKFRSVEKNGTLTYKQFLERNMLPENKKIIEEEESIPTIKIKVSPIILILFN
jgi:hypothetical protein